MKRQKIIAKAQKHALKGRHAKAITEYTKLVEADPKDVRIWLRIADLQHKDGRHDEAVQTYLKVAEHHSSDGFALKAIAVYRKALEVPTAPTEIHLRLAELFSQHGLTCDAMKHLQVVVGHFSHGPVRLAAQRQMVSLQPNDPTHRVALGDTYLQSGLQPQALYCYEKAAELHRFALELTGPDSGRTDALIALLEQIVQLKEESHEEVQELARLYGRPAMLLDTCISDDDAASMATVIEPDDNAAGGRDLAPSPSIEIPVEIVPPLSEVNTDDELLFLDQREDEASFDSVVIPEEAAATNIAASDVVALEPAAYTVPTGHGGFGLAPEPALPLKGDVMPGALLLEPTPDPCPRDLPDVDVLTLTPEPALSAVPTGDLHYQEIPWHRMDTNHDRELPDANEIRSSIFPRIKPDVGAPPLLPRRTSPGYCEVGPAEETLPGLPGLLGRRDLPDGDDLERAFERIAQPRSHRHVGQTRVGLPPSATTDREPAPAKPDVEVAKPRPRPAAESRQRQHVLARFVHKVERDQRTDPGARLSKKVRQLTCKTLEQRATSEMVSAMLRSGLQKVDHFLKRNLLQDAEAILKDLAHVSPDDPEVEDRLAEFYSRELSTMVRSLPAS